MWHSFPFSDMHASNETNAKGAWTEPKVSRARARGGLLAHMPFEAIAELDFTEECESLKKRKSTRASPLLHLLLGSGHWEAATHLLRPLPDGVARSLGRPARTLAWLFVCMDEAAYVRCQMHRNPTTAHVPPHAGEGGYVCLSGPAAYLRRAIGRCTTTMLAWRLRCHQRGAYPDVQAPPVSSSGILSDFKEARSL